MASSTSPLLPLLLTILLAVLSSLGGAAAGCYTAIFSFGDSLADTGNLLISQGENLTNHAARLPYGQTYFHRPTGRFTDGRVVADFIAQALGLPLLPPYLAGPGDHGFREGANFAVAGATALENGFFREKGMSVEWTNYSLGVQIDWFKQLLPSLCSSESECKYLLGRSLFLMGEIGGNDYNHAFSQGRAFDEIRNFVPEVIHTISSAINTLIELGARTLLVPGNLPIGCSSAYLTQFRSPSREDYDRETRCIKWLNEFAMYHNNQLQDELHRLRLLHPHATIIYADYYEAAMKMFHSPRHLGFATAPLVACCGGGGPYNYNPSIECGNRGSNLCQDVSRYVCWDGLHLTEAAYKTISVGLLEGPYTIPPINLTCSHSHIQLRKDVTHNQNVYYY